MSHATNKKNKSDSQPSHLHQSRRERRMDQDSCTIVTFSASSKAQLFNLISDAKDIFRTSETNLHSLAYKINTSNRHDDECQRAAVVGRSCQEIADKLEQGKFCIGEVQENRPKLCFLFNGYGGCYSGICKPLYDNIPAFRRAIDKCDDYISSRHPGVSCKQALFGEDSSTTALNPTYLTSMLEFVHFGLTEVFQKWGIFPDIVLGHSIGEYTAAQVAGINSMEDVLKGADWFSNHHSKVGGGGMVAVFCEEKITVKVMHEVLAQLKLKGAEGEKEWLDFSARNSPCQSVVGGTTLALQAFLEMCKNNGIVAIRLPGQKSYHTRGVDGALPSLREVVKKWKYNPSNQDCTYVSSLTGKVLVDMDDDYWVRHYRQPVNFAGACATAGKIGARVFVEIGGNGQLSAMMAQNVDTTEDEPFTFLKTLSKGRNELDVMIDTLAKLYVMGFNVDWSGFYEGMDSLGQFETMPQIHYLCPTTIEFFEEPQDSSSFWAEMNKNIDNRSVLLRHILHCMKKVCPNSGEAIKADDDFQSLGLDSLQAIKLKEMLQKTLGSKVTLGFNTLLECHDANQLAVKLENLISCSGTEELRRREKEELVNLVKEDSMLWPHVHASSPPVALESIHTVLVTGASGQLAPYILEQLSSRPQIHKIYCVIRSSGNITPMQRLREHLASLGLDKRIQMHKLEAVNGNVVDEHFGMGKSGWDRLSLEVDAIFHLAVTANHMAPYVKEDNKYNGVRAVNVLGTQRVLEFASVKKTKWVFHASTLFAMWIKGDAILNRMPEDWPVTEDLTEDLGWIPNFGYGISKHVADDLVHQASLKGIPCKSFRFPKVGGDQITGHQKVLGNHFFCKFLHYIICGSMPKMDIPLLLMNVDVCAKLSVDLFFHPEAKISDIYNLVPPYDESELNIPSITEEFEVPLRLLDKGTKMVTSLGREGARREMLRIVRMIPALSHLLTKLEAGEDPDPNDLFENQYLMQALTPIFGGSLTPIPWPQYKAEVLEKVDNNCLISPWLEFYTNEDSLFQLFADGRIPTWSSWEKNKEDFLRGGKVEQLFPNLRELVENPLDTLRREIRYTVRHGKEIFFDKIC